MSLQTPPANAIIRIRCVLGPSNSVRSQISACCNASFYVLFNYPTLNFAADPKLQGMFTVKNLPVSNTLVQGVSVNMSLISLNPSVQHTNITNLNLEALPSICFKLEGASAQRCVRIFLVTDPYEVQIPGYFKAAPDWPTREAQAEEIKNLQAGVTYVIKIVAKHEFANDTLAIELRGRECAATSERAAPPCPSPELPNMRWLGPTRCFRPAPGGGCPFVPARDISANCTPELEHTCVAAAAPPGGGSPDVRNWNWYRLLEYTPRGLEIGNTYRVAFQAAAPGAFTSR
eukprot:CAMPEP_0172190046 /NCGR_PEP_ID=MMETSP1050-20130122/22883_1 /TAXON_ID=233186 /ORGANISM="Cryptomonas curvata, Strain CCAP979/52" /LENGTH=287 /DNA_ID=CAMNT_0012864851 /DNA_START=184 /DNA_END=1043 /DNA_ORIENTATION=+